MARLFSFRTPSADFVGHRFGEGQARRLRNTVHERPTHLMLLTMVEWTTAGEPGLAAEDDADTVGRSSCIAQLADKR